jgi:hypothetical protein
MAVPTFTSVAPAIGSPGGGQIVEIVGTNFRIQTADPTADPQPTSYTVEVTFNGVPAEFTLAVSSTLLRVAVPDYRGDPLAVAGFRGSELSRFSFPAVDIVIQNLEDDGDPISGETVTAAAAYTYQQPLIRAPEGDPPLLQVLKTFLALLMKQVVTDVAQSTHTDFGEEGETITALAEHPSVAVRMNVLRDPEYSQFDNEQIIVPVGGGRFNQYDAPKTYMLVLPLVLSAKTETEMQHMLAQFLNISSVTPWLNVQPDPDWPLPQVNRYPLEFMQLPQQAGSADRTNVKAYSAQVRIRGIPVVHGNPIAEQIPQISTIILSTAQLPVENVASTEV